MQNGNRRSARIVMRLMHLSCLAMVGIAVLLGGCSSKTLFICQDQRVNTAAGRPAGEPLEVTVVCVYPDDLEKRANESLKPTSDINAAEWYEFRPQPGPSQEGRFDIPEDQIFMLAGEGARGTYGKIMGPPLRGAIEDGDAKRKIEGIKYRKWMKVGSRNAVIYVFPRFLDKKGNTLPVEPLEFNPPGSRTKYYARVGVKPSGEQGIWKVDNADCDTTK